MRVHQQAAFVLLNRPYSESSWIVEIFSREYGRFAVMAKGARRIKSKLKGVLLPYQPLLVSWSGKGEIPTLTAAEIDLTDFDLIDNELTGDALVCGFYCNELLVNLLHRHDPHKELFDVYIATVIALSQSRNNDQLGIVLRDFERSIVKQTGYEISFTTQADGKTEIQRDEYYRFQQGRGFISCSVNERNAVLGHIIRSLSGHADPLLSTEHMTQSKHLMRDILHQNLGYKQILSRDLFFPRER